MKPLPKSLRVALVLEEPSMQNSTGGHSIGPAVEPFNLPGQVGRLGIYNFGGHRIVVSHLEHEWRNLRKGYLVLVNPAQEGIPPINVVVFANPLLEPRFGSSVERRHNRPEAGPSQRAPAPRIPEARPPPTGTMHGVVGSPGTHDGSRPGNHYRAARRAEGCIQGDRAVVYYPHSEAVCYPHKGLAKPISKGGLVLRSSRPGHARTHRQSIDRPARRKYVPDEIGQQLGRRRNPLLLQVGSRPRALHPV